MGVKEILQTVSLLSLSTSRRIGMSSSLVTLLICCLGFLIEKEEHSLLRCSAFQQWKHNPFSMQHFLSSGVSFPMRMTSTSIALESLALEELEVKD